MKIERNYDFCKRLLEVHKKDRRDHSLTPSPDEFIFRDTVRILIQPDAGEIAQTAAKDFADYLFVSMNVTAFVTYDDGKAGENCVRLVLNTDLGEASERRGHRITVEDMVTVEGYDENGIAQGLYYLEDVMNLRFAPFLKKGVETRRILFVPRTIMSGYGIDEYPDAYLARLAHHGFSGIMLWIRGLNISKKRCFCNFKDIALRAAKYGLEIYVESYTTHDVYPEGEEAQAHYDAMYGELFRECPFIKGIILVGEACKFEGRDQDIPKGREAWAWPSRDWPLLVNMVQKAVRKQRPDAVVVMCSYNWGQAPKEDRQRLIADMPDGITWECGYEMFATFNLNGRDMRCFDYSLRVVEPGYYFKTEAEAIGKRKLPFMTIGNTGGKTWDFGVIPYIPAPYRWAERFEYMRSAHDRYGLSGLSDSIHFGCHPSFISEIAKWAFATPRVDLKVKIPQILASYFGREHVKVVDEALTLWSQALSYNIPSNEDQYGALRIGPSYPFYAGLGPCKGISPPQAPYVMHKLEEGMFHNTYFQCSPGFLIAERIDDEIASFRQEEDLLLQGIHMMEQLKKPNEELQRLINMGKFMYRTVVTAIHRKLYWKQDQLRIKALEEKDPIAHGQAIDEMLELLRKERENAEQAIPLVEFDSALGYEPSIEYATDRARIEWKLNQVDEEAAKLRAETVS